MKHLTLGFIGLGLIGGSIAKALRAADPKTTIIAYDINKDSLSLAKEEGIADTITLSIDASFATCDYIFLCAPVSENDENLKILKKFLSSSCILTDVGSVKSGIHRHIDELGLSGQFIGGHPMAGSERFGYVNSKAILLENAYYILTPSDSVPAEKVVHFRELVSSMGAIPLVLDAELHDYVTAAISHLPHITASSLVNLVKDSDSKDGIMKMIAAGGFKDITRIASSSPEMWQQICLTNTENIASLLDTYIEALTLIKEKLREKDSQFLYRFFDEARIYRDSFIETSSGPIKKSYSITIDIVDETGALASIATMLALNNISIKNIGIVHNRELEEGALRIEFYEEAAIKTAGEILKSRGYTIHEKK
ncbi:MAG: prephenate dehydrogenase [Clostridiales bacterium]|nr:prephenate dehydrogenase [Clostridiales bacterium]